MAVTLADICIFAIFFLLVLYYFGVKNYDHFKNTPVKFIKPSLPFLGTLSGAFLKQDDGYQLVKRVYSEYPDEKYIGLFEGTKPLIMLKDLELIKDIGIKNFDSFHDHRNFLAVSSDDIMSHVLFVMQGEKWREMRAALSPVFTSAKMKNLYIFMEECAKDTVEYLMKQDEIKAGKVMEIDVKDVTSRYTNDVIANTVFGIKVNSLEDRNNEIYKYGLLASNANGIPLLKVFCFSMLPKLAKMLNIHFTSSNVSNFFQKMVNESIKHRERTGLIRHDMINLLMQAKKGTLAHDATNADVKDTGFATVEESSIGMKDVQKKWTDMELAAQAFIFFSAGFDSTALMLMFFMYELMRSPEVQRKLQKTIDDHLEKTEGKVSYGDILSLKYLDMCLSENLRIWSAPFVDRLCHNSFTLPPPNDRTTKTYEVKKGNLIWIPISAMMHDPKYFPNPEKFDPERFSDENKSSIDPISYLPFGIGPRNCIGSRFALLEMKIFIFYLLSKFDIVPGDNTQIPLRLKKSFFLIQPEKNQCFGLKLRDKC